jgi:SAM-dependent methyltransferase
MNKLPNHLGGHANITHLDHKCIEYLMEKYNIKTAYDLGCGPGGMVNLMISKGIDAIGIDGDFTLERTCPIILHDFTKGKISNLAKKDFTWSIEFLEHFDEEYMDNYFDVINHTNIVLCTASQNPTAHHHVNVKPLDYWISQFESRGFTYSEVDTEYIRKNNNMKREFITQTGMVFLKNSMLEI